MGLGRGDGRGRWWWGGEVVVGEGVNGVLDLREIRCGLLEVCTGVWEAFA